MVSRDHCPAVAAAALAAASMLPSLQQGQGLAGRGDGHRVGDVGQVGVEQARRPVLARVAAGGQRREGQRLAGPEPDQQRVPPAPAAATRPPLSATPCGVTSDQRLAPAGRTNSCQKLFSDAAEPPMTATAQVPCGVTSEVVSGAVCDPQARAW